jgi:transposase
VAKITRFVGLDVHADSIAVAVAEQEGEVRSLGTIPKTPEAMRKMMKRLGPAATLHVCYEAGPCGYVLYWQLTQLGVKCEVIAPTLIPTKAGDRVKTDRGDAEKLARCLRGGDLTAVWVPDAAHEALRDIVRAREAAKKDQLRARHRLQKFLLRNGRRMPGQKAWTNGYFSWVRALKFDQPAQQATFLDYFTEVEHSRERIARLDRSIDEAIAAAPAETRAVVEALQALRGVAKVVAVTSVAEVGRFSRFESPRQLMGYSGMVSSEYSTGGPGKAKRGGITKTGNAHLRRVVGEAAWSYRFRPALSPALRQRSRTQGEPVKEIAWKAQHRLCGRYRKLLGRGKSKQQVATAVGRELLGFMRAIAVQVEAECDHANRRAA